MKIDLVVCDCCQGEFRDAATRDLYRVAITIPGNWNALSEIGQCDPSTNTLVLEHACGKCRKALASALADAVTACRYKGAEPATPQEWSAQEEIIIQKRAAP